MPSRYAGCILHKTESVYPRIVCYGSFSCSTVMGSEGNTKVNRPNGMRHIAVCFCPAPMTLQGLYR